MSAFSNSRAASEQFSRATQSQLWIDLRHKKCVTGCGAQIKAKWIVQQGGHCNACFKAKALANNSTMPANAQDDIAMHQSEADQ